MKRVTRILPTLFIVIMLAAGIGVMAYPTVSDWWNSGRQSRAVAFYNDTVAALPEEDYTAYLEAAREYNEALREIGSAAAFADPECIPGYYEALDVTGNGMMGTITIDKIGVDLPIYHGTDDSVLARGAGHMEGSSLPVGGRGNHPVISAHRGLPSSRLFTDLDRMEVGDIFILHVLGDDLAYQVDQIVTVLPTETEELYIDKNEDYCTLMTCTPYGINTHRLLVRGVRTYLSPEEIAQIEAETAEAVSDTGGIIKIIILIVAAVVIVLLLSQIFVMISRRRKKK